jgi:hypothetical protein
MPSATSITQVLKGFRGLMHARSRVRAYWPSVLWAVLVIVIAVQSWWSMFGLRHHEDWTFVEFSAVLAQTIVLYLLAALVLPDIFGGTIVDLREHYYDHRRWFFSLFVILIATSLLKGLAIEHKLPEPADLRFHIAFALTSITGIFIGNARYHEVLAGLGAISIFAYIAFLFERLV